MRILIEAAVETVADALAAQSGGADRLELCGTLEVGGATPSLGMFLAVREAVSLPICVMIRPRGGSFDYSPDELAVMLRDIALFLPYRPAGFVFGPLTPHKQIDVAACRLLIEQCQGTPAVFHRAFDEVPSRDEALEMLIGLGFTRILTSGGAATAMEGATRIQALNQRAAGRIEILPGGRVRASNAQAIVDQTDCTQVHGSFSTAGRTNAAEVAATRAVLDRRQG